MTTKKKKEKLNIATLEIGQKVSYGFYSNVTYEGVAEDGEVILKDKAGNFKKVYKELFENDARVQED